MPRKKKPRTLEELYAERENTKEELRKAEQREKILTHQLSKLTRNARTHRLCTIGAMLETFLPNPDVLTDEKIMALLKAIFQQDKAKEAVEKLADESEVKKSLIP